MEITFSDIVGVVIFGTAVYYFIINKIEFEYRFGAGGNKRGAFHVDLTPKSAWKKSTFTGKWVRPFSVLLALGGLAIIFLVRGGNVLFSF